MLWILSMKHLISCASELPLSSPSVSWPGAWHTQLLLPSSFLHASSSWLSCVSYAEVSLGSPDAGFLGTCTSAFDLQWSKKPHSEKTVTAIETKWHLSSFVALYITITGQKVLINHIPIVPCAYASCILSTMKWHLHSWLQMNWCPSIGLSL